MSNHDVHNRFDAHRKVVRSTLAGSESCDVSFNVLESLSISVKPKDFRRFTELGIVMSMAT